MMDRLLRAPLAGQRGPRRRWLISIQPRRLLLQHGQCGGDDWPPHLCPLWCLGGRSQNLLITDEETQFGRTIRISMLVPKHRQQNQGLSVCLHAGWGTPGKDVYCTTATTHVTGHVKWWPLLSHIAEVHMSAKGYTASEVSEK